MARPREFDEAEVIDRVLRRFWTNGFEGTSVSDLTEATGLSKASLYGAFGDKEELFVRSLAAYGDCFGQHLQAREESPVTAMLMAFVATSNAYDGLGCFGVHGADELPVLPPRAREAVLELVAFTDRLLLDRVREAQRVGEIDPTRDPEEVATLLSVFLRGLSPTARLGATCAALETRVRAMISLVAPR